MNIKLSPKDGGTVQSMPETRIYLRQIESCYSDASISKKTRSNPSERFSKNDL